MTHVVDVFPLRFESSRYNILYSDVPCDGIVIYVVLHGRHFQTDGSEAEYRSQGPTCSLAAPSLLLVSLRTEFSKGRDVN